jgi:hypothetical protein
LQNLILNGLSKAGAVALIAYAGAAEWKDYNQGLFPLDRCSSHSDNGNHVVQLTGWGVESVPNPANPGETIKVGYWKVKLGGQGSSSTQCATSASVAFGTNACTSGPCADQHGFETELLFAVKTDGPFIAYVDATNWQMYGGGIFPHSKCSSHSDYGNHIVQLLGYGQERGIPFWLTKNSATCRAHRQFCLSKLSFAIARPFRLRRIRRRPFHEVTPPAPRLVCIETNPGESTGWQCVRTECGDLTVWDDETEVFSSADIFPDDPNLDLDRAIDEALGNAADADRPPVICPLAALPRINEECDCLGERGTAATTHRVVPLPEVRHPFTLFEFDHLVDGRYTTGKVLHNRRNEVRRVKEYIKCRVSCRLCHLVHTQLQSDVRRLGVLPAGSYKELVMYKLQTGCQHKTHLLMPYGPGQHVDSMMQAGVGGNGELYHQFLQRSCVFRGYATTNSMENQRQTLAEADVLRRADRSKTTFQHRNDLRGAIHMADVKRGSAVIHCAYCHALYTLCEQYQLTPNSPYVAAEYEFLRNIYPGGRAFTDDFLATMKKGDAHIHPVRTATDRRDRSMQCDGRACRL